MIILEDPYVSPELATFAADRQEPVLDTPAARQAGLDYGLHLRACLETHLSIMKRFNSMLAMAI
ncbi:hypothetical protein [uncultured Desulfovibrio sp.]|uniref:hypothetical protein n=1 Tax=uncultured Desulfovibrio sp. TaxID=167968 RepID=UPI002638E0CA|nr:hypothetical protein [uncultured Desulfovibrio sp.]